MTRRRLAILAKLAVSAALVAVLVRRVELAPLAARFAALDPFWLALALAVFMGQLLLTGRRYALIGRAIGAALPDREAMRLTLIGQFFSQTLPSAVGGDAVRAALARARGLSWGRAVSAVLCDRLAALIALGALAALTLPIFVTRIDALWARGLAAALAAGFAAGAALLVLAAPARIGALARWRLLRPFASLILDLRRIAVDAPERDAILALSAVVHLGVIASVWLLARALGVAAGFVDCVLIVPPIVLATLAPVSIAGWGVREGAMILAFGLVGVAESDALALSVTFGLAQIVVGIPGGVIWMLSGRPRVTAESSPPAGS
jgi:uncharacterized membrane protein YbhN (UPF0104 family)